MNSDIIDSANTFISYHWYTHYSGGLPSKSTLISRASSQLATDAALLRDYCNDIIGEELNIALTEFNWTADPSASPDYSTTDEAFMDSWTTAAMNACINNDLWAAHFWNWGGYTENTMAIIRNQSHRYSPKYQYGSIQDFLAGSGEKTFTSGGTLQNIAYGTKSFKNGGQLLAQSTKPFSSGGWLVEEEIPPGINTFSQGGHLQGLGTIPFISSGHLTSEPENLVPFVSGGSLINETPGEYEVTNKFTEILKALESHHASEYIWQKGMWKPGMWEQNNLVRKAIAEMEKSES
jgi:hypothetical protein